ncbi:hypothetical protein BAUCODRAFT_54635, partial [Baudoinia panamericana UAMH 10762]
MKAKRAKKSRKLMQQYALTFGLREPYQVLLDAAIIREAARCKMHLGNMLASTLQGAIKPMITQCCIRHLYSLPTTTEAERREKEICIEVAKAAERRRCGHHELETPLGTGECLREVVDPKGAGVNRHRYVVACQDGEVRRAMRRDVVGVPLVYVHRSVMILEPMAGRSEEVREAGEKGKMRAGLVGRREKRKREEDGDGGDDGGAAGDGAVAKKRKVKGPKGPNPLSVKKAKKD